MTGSGCCDTGYSGPGFSVTAPTILWCSNSNCPRVSYARAGSRSFANIVDLGFYIFVSLVSYTIVLYILWITLYLWKDEKFTEFSRCNGPCTQYWKERVVYAEIVTKFPIFDIFFSFFLWKSTLNLLKTSFNFFLFSPKVPHPPKVLTARSQNLSVQDCVGILMSPQTLWVLSNLGGPS